jgi:hypothetical protein
MGRSKKVIRVQAVFESSVEDNLRTLVPGRESNPHGSGGSASKELEVANLPGRRYTTTRIVGLVSQPAKSAAGLSKLCADPAIPAASHLLSCHTPMNRTVPRQEMVKDD